MTDPLCTRDDVFLLGLSAQAFVVRARPVEGVDASTGIFRLKGHGFDLSDQISFEAPVGSLLPTGISTFVLYDPLPLSFDTFQVQGFTSFVSTGKGTFGVAYDPGRRIDRHILEVSAEIDNDLIAHATPLIPPFPMVVVGLAARMAARAAVLSLSIENPQYRVAIDRLMQREEADMKLRDGWRDGRPISPRPIDQTDETPDNGAVAASDSIPINWTQRRSL